MLTTRVLATVVTAISLVGMLAACSRVGYTNEVPQSAVSCADVSASVIQRVRADRTSAANDRDIEYLANNCADAYEVTVDYVSARSSDPQFQFDTCAEWREHIRAEAVELLRTDGLCSDPASADAGSSTPAPGGISWADAGSYVGTNQRVCGPLVTMRTDNDDVFLNLGRDYPNPERFTIVLWDVGGVESLPAGTTLCATGTISQYNGAAQVELSDVGPVEVWE